jgi:hypothetical protein
MARCPQRVHSSRCPPSMAVRHRAMASSTLTCFQLIHLPRLEAKLTGPVIVIYKDRMTCHSILVVRRLTMIDDNSGFNSNRIIALCLLFMCSVLLLPGTIASQTPAELQRTIRQMASSKATAVIMVEIQCKPGTADHWREAFEKDIVPAIREAIQKDDAFSNFSYLETPLPASNSRVLARWTRDEFLPTTKCCCAVLVRSALQH